ncbi:MAG: PA domain-containing protein [Ilumatobacteraceae bacterium]
MVGNPGAADRALSVAAWTVRHRTSRVLRSSAPISSDWTPTRRRFRSPDRFAALRDAAGGIGLGCDPAEYVDVETGEIVVTARGECARVDRAIIGEAAGAAAVIMVDNGDGLPPFEGDIPGVTIPFIGMPATAADGLRDLDGAAVEIAEGDPLVNPTYLQPSDFTLAALHR